MHFSKFPNYTDDSGYVNLVNGDTIEVLKCFDEATVDLVITSPPYWNAVEYEGDDNVSHQTYDEYISWLGQVWELCFRALRPNGKLVINTPILPIPKTIINQTPRHIKNINNDIDMWLMNNTPFLRYSVYIWQKQTSKMMFGSYPYPPNILENNTIEFLSVYVKPGQSKKVAQSIKDENLLKQAEWIDLTQQVWFMYPSDVKRHLTHPAPFPQKLPARFMKLFSFGSQNKDHADIILDPFNGAGTTTSVAKMLNRRSVGIELSKKYHRIAKERVDKTLPGQNLNWLVGRPKYLNSEELDALQNEIAEQERDKENNNKKAEKKHKRKTYGRSFEDVSNKQTSMFDDLEDK